MLMPYLGAEGGCEWKGDDGCGFESPKSGEQLFEHVGGTEAVVPKCTSIEMAGSGVAEYIRGGARRPGTTTPGWEQCC